MQYLIIRSHTVKPDQRVVPKLKLLSICNVDIYRNLYKMLLGILEERRTHNVGLKVLVIRSCHVPTLECEKELKDLVERIVWDEVMELGPGPYDSESEETDFENEYDSSYWSP
jgi:hypothetical protein